MSKILCFGNFASDNMGDNAFFRAYEKHLAPHEVKAVNREEGPPVTHNGADLWMIGAGTYFKHDPQGLDYIFRSTDGYSRGKKVAYVGAGVDSVHKFTLGRIHEIREALLRVDLITVRDPYTQWWMTHQLGLPEESVHYRADLAFASDAPDPELSADMLADLKRHDRPMMAFVLRHWCAERFQIDALADIVALCIERLADEHGVLPVFCPTYGPKMYRQNLTPTVECQLACPYVSIAPETPEDVRQSVFAHMEMVFSIPLHGLILPTLYRVPTCGIAYSLKCTEAAKQLGIMEGVIHHDYIEHLTWQYQKDTAQFQAGKEWIAEQIANAYTNRAKVRGRFETLIPEYVASAASTFDLVNDLLEQECQQHPDATPWTR